MSSGKPKKKIQIGSYVKVKKLGQGTYGKVYLTTHAETGKYYVLKEVDLSMLKPHQKEQAIREIRFLNSFKHPAIIAYEEYFQVKYKGHIILYIVMEFADGGDLGGLIKTAQQKKQYLDEEQVIDWFVQLCLALKHIHDRKIIHRDIKSENVFLLKNRRVKLGDFGVARSLEHTVDQAKTQVGTPYYLSPEICQNQPYNHKTDVWAMGAVMYEILCLRHPFEAKNLHSLVLKIVGEQQPPISRKYSKELRSAVMSCLLKDPAKRPAVKDLLELPFIKARIPKFLNDEMREDEFSHTILHGDFALAGLVREDNSLPASEIDRKVPIDLDKPQQAAAAVPVKKKERKQPDLNEIPTRVRTSHTTKLKPATAKGGRPISSRAPANIPQPRKGEENCSRCNTKLGRSYFRCEYCDLFVLCSTCLSRSHHDPNHTFAHIVKPNSQADRSTSHSSHANLQSYANYNPVNSTPYQLKGGDKKIVSRFDELRNGPSSRRNDSSGYNSNRSSARDTGRREGPKEAAERRKREAADARIRELQEASRNNARQRNIASQRKAYNQGHSMTQPRGRATSMENGGYEQKFLRETNLPKLDNNSLHGQAVGNAGQQAFKNALTASDEYRQKNGRMYAQR